MKKVSADTVTELTMAAAPTPGAGGTPPTAEQMIDQIRSRLTLRIESLDKSERRGQESAPSKKSSKTAFKISHSRAVKDLREFEKIVANPPNGFCLAPVLYSPIEQGQNARVYSQFSSRVRPKFMRYLAENHAEELGALGICPQGIERMKKGLDPVDPSGRLYDVNVDHIIERFGGGKASLTEEVDPLMPPGSKPTYLVNHFSNFILLPTWVHELKNDLNELQGAVKTPPGQSKWVLMIVPQACPEHSSYVAQPQGHLQTRQANLHARNTTPLQLAESTAYQVNSILDGAASNPAQKDLLKPALGDMSGRLTEAFNDASKPRQDMAAFLRFYQGESFRSLREKVEILPPEETEQLRKTLLWIDNGLETRFNRYAAKKPANNNLPKVSKTVVEQPPHVPHRKKQSRAQRKRGHRKH
jgi:hypothetical protein